MNTQEFSAGEKTGHFAAESAALEAPLPQHALQRTKATAEEESVHFGGTRASHLRSSTKRRIARLNALLSELAARDISHLDVVRFFGCSLSAARNYMRELRDAAVVTLETSAERKTSIDHERYRLSPNARLVKDFMDAQYSHRILAAGRLPRRDIPSGSRHFHILADDVKYAVKICNLPARRDPLVAALFGERTSP